MTNIGVRCRRARLRWFGHVKRREDNYVGRRMLSIVPFNERKGASEATLEGHHQRHAVCWCDVRRHARRRDLEGIHICRSDPILNGRISKKKKEKKRG